MSTATQTTDDARPHAAPARVRYIQTDEGRRNSRRPKQRQDCVVRAFAAAFALSYDVAYDCVAALGRRSGRSTPKTIWQKELNRLAQRVAFPAVAGQPRMNVVTFVRDHGYEGRWIVQCAGHVFAVVDGAVRDDGPPRWGACVYAAWRVTDAAGARTTPPTPKPSVADVKNAAGEYVEPIDFFTDADDDGHADRSGHVEEMRGVR